MRFASSLHVAILVTICTALYPIRSSALRINYVMPHISNNDHRQKTVLSSSSTSTTAARGYSDGKYGIGNNSTIPSPEDVASLLGVIPPVRASKRKWKRAWDTFRFCLPILHLFDSANPPNSQLCLACLWWKALSGNDVSSPVYDKGLSHDLLPRGVGRLLIKRRLIRRALFPRLHHANVEIRTAYLDKAISNEIRSVREKSILNNTKVRLVSLGAGYDVRSVKFRVQGLIDEAYELDRPEVISSKRKMLGPKRLQRRRSEVLECHMPTFMAVDLNDLEQVRTALQEIVSSSSSKASENVDEKWYNIFVFEGVMIYLDEGVPGELLSICSDVVSQNSDATSSDPIGGSVCFADRLDNIPGGDYDLGTVELENHGWELVDWCPKPGLARHMGTARLLLS